jgi:hypothetical protein
MAERGRLEYAAQEQPVAAELDKARKWERRSTHRRPVGPPDHHGRHRTEAPGRSKQDVNGAITVLAESGARPRPALRDIVGVARCNPRP